MSPPPHRSKPHPDVLRKFPEPVLLIRTKCRYRSVPWPKWSLPPRPMRSGCGARSGTAAPILAPVMRHGSIHMMDQRHDRQEPVCSVSAWRQRLLRMCLRSLGRSRRARRVGNTRYVAQQWHGGTYSEAKKQIKCIMENSGPPCRRCADKSMVCTLNKSLQTLISERTE